MNWIKVKDSHPPIKKHVLLYYRKGKKYIITEGYLTDRAEDLGDGDMPVEAWRAIGYGLTYFDACDRQLQSLTAKKSKNEVISWTELPII